MELQTGAIVDRYVIEAVIGRGGMAVVYRMRHRQLGTLHALKMLMLPAATLRARLLQEGRVQAQLQHPNIVAVTDVIEVDGAPGLVMEYIKGPDLDELLSTRPLTIAQADVIAQGVMRGVAAAHRLGLIHRDLKPGNVMMAITDRGLVPKVADFGLAKLLSTDANNGGHGTRSGLAMGTPAYMAPEQIRDAKHVDKRADVFATAAILYELVTGHRCFDGSDILEIYTKVAHADFVPVLTLCPDLPPRMLAAINGGLRVDIETRIPSIDALMNTWRGEEGLDETDEIPQYRRPEAFSASLLASAEAISSDQASVSSPDASTESGSGHEPAKQTYQGGVSFLAMVSNEEAVNIDLSGIDSTRWEFERVETLAPPLPDPHDSETPTRVLRRPSNDATVQLSEAPVVTETQPVARSPLWAALAGAFGTLIVVVALIAFGTILGVGVLTAAQNVRTDTPQIEATLAPPPETQPETVAEPKVDPPKVIEATPPAASLPVKKPAPKPVSSDPPRIQVRVPAADPTAKAEPVKAAPAPKGTVGLRGDATQVTLHRDGLSFPLGKVPPGTYTIRAEFPGQGVIQNAGSVKVVANTQSTITCTAGFFRCVAK